jgi:DNA uptake protein ComE-like DNA-binding protein
LRFLLMAKQHKERGEDASALKMYELALPFFPGQEKLLKKIDNLRAKIQAKREEARTAAATSADTERRRPPISTAPIVQSSMPTTNPTKDAEIKQRKTKANIESDEEFNASVIARDYDDDDSFLYKTTKSKKHRSKGGSKTALRILADESDDGTREPPSPRTQQLLDIVNSRNVTLIKGLSGVGAKKARDLVEFLELQSEDEGNTIKSLRQLRAVPGVGAKTVERAYEGIAGLVA